MTGVGDWNLKMLWRFQLKVLFHYKFCYNLQHCNNKTHIIQHSTLWSKRSLDEDVKCVNRKVVSPLNAFLSESCVKVPSYPPPPERDDSGLLTPGVAGRVTPGVIMMACICSTLEHLLPGAGSWRGDSQRNVEMRHSNAACMILA